MYYRFNVFAAVLGDGQSAPGQSRLNIEIQNGDAAKTTNRFGWLAVAILVVGAGLRIAHYSFGEVLWYDELALVRNLLEKTVGDLLTTPLDHAQVAPPGFMLMAKAAVVALGNNEYVLRLFPLLCSLASLPLFADVARRMLRPSAALLAVTLFSVSPALIGFASQVKPYSTDVALGLVLTTLTLRWWESRHKSGAARNAVLLGTAGFAALPFSHAAVLVLAGLGAALLIEGVLRRELASLRSLAPTAILWSAGSFVAIMVALQSTSPSTHAYMQAYWSAGFMPVPPRAVDDVMWLWRAFRGFFQRQVLFPLPTVGVLLVTLGALVLIKRWRWPALVILATIGAAFIASALARYPVGERVSLFLLPGILILLAEGVDWIRLTAATVWRPLGAAVVTLVVLTSAHTLYANFPLGAGKDIRDVFAYVQERRQPEDVVYVFYNAAHAVSHYGPRYGLVPQGVVIGSCPGGNNRKLLEELDRFRGIPRLWVIISHAVGPYREKETIFGYLSTIGVERDGIAVGKPRLGSSAYLYDLSDPERLGVVSLQTYVLPERERGVREFPCPPAYQ